MKLNSFDKGKLLLFLLLALLLVETVAAQSNILDTLQNSPALQGITGGTLQDFYTRFWWLVDLVVYSLILGYAIRFGLSKSNAFGNQGNKLGLVIAIVFAVGAVLFEQQQGFRLGNFGPLAFGIGILVIGFAVWKAVGGMGFGENSKIVFALLFLFIYGFISKYLQPLRERTDYANLVPLVLDILAIVMFVLLFIGVLSLIGRLFSGKAFGRVSSRPGNAAVTTAEDQAALAEEKAEAKERAAEIAEEAKELSDISAIRSLTINESRLYDDIRKAIKKIIDALQKMVKAGRMSQDLVGEVTAKVGEIINDSSKIKTLEQSLRARIGELEQLEIAEKRTIDMMFSGTRKEITEEITARKAAGWTGKGLNNAKWAQRKSDFEKDAERRIGEQIATVKGTLEAHAIAVGKFEIAFANYFTQAEAFLRANDIPRAILQLEVSMQDIDRIQAGLKALQGADVNKIQALIRRRLNDLKAETKTGTLNSIGIKRQVAGVKQAQAAGRGLRGLAGKPVTIVGKIFRRP